MDRNTSAVGEDRREKRAQLDPGNLMLLVYTLVIGLLILCGGLLQAHASVQSTDRLDDLRPEGISQGELLVAAAAGKVAPALLLGQEVNITISGIAARVRVSQEFQNTGADWVEGVYVFPLPDESAVDRLRLMIGEREIVGEIREREEAKAIYERARAEGKKTSLLAQNRPNIFTTRVANIGPGERVKVVIEYQQLVQYADNIFSLRFPMAITPRYIPGRATGEAIGEATGEVEKHAVSFTGEGWAKDTDQVSDASQITPPVAAPESGVGPTTTLSVDLVSGFPLTRLESLYHRMKTTQHGKDHYSLAFTDEVLADRDFVLEWQPEKSEQAVAALIAEDQGDSRYLLLMLMPPRERSEVHVPREAIFVLDVSGSMAGPSIAQAKEALRRALQRLQPSDYFNLISFSNSARALYPTSVPAVGYNVREALSYLETLRADGGTEMKEALTLALDGQERPHLIRQVIFLTDGAVGNEAELLALINQRLGDSRLFTVGIGSAPNSYFMTRAATIGRGTHTYIGEVSEVAARMDALLTQLESPVLSDITIRAADGSGETLESYPERIPDLYYGEPLMVAIRTGKQNTALTVSGEQAGKRWEYEVDTAGYGTRPGIGALWARKKIRSDMELLALGADEAEVKTRVLATALEHRLVSRYTSLVAVDKVVARPEGTTAAKAVVKTAVPFGLQMDAVFGGGARTATPGPMYLLSGFMTLLTAGLLWLMRRRLW